MAKVHIAGVQSDGSGGIRVMLSNGDELTLLTAVDISTSTDSVSIFKIEGYIREVATNDSECVK